MQQAKIDFKKEKVLMPDGRYLLFFDFNPNAKDQVIPKANSIQIEESEGTKDV
ncbi:MAG: hypothetical protein GXY86_11990 [Firmicutes bacterium]|nr:hypothetical protein [Bacillota bacterium]